MLRVKNFVKTASAHPAAAPAILPRLIPYARFSPFTNDELFVWKYPRPTYFYFPNFVSLPTSVSIQKALTWIVKGANFMMPLRIINRPPRYSWVAPEMRRELRPLVSNVNRIYPRRFKRKRPRLISTKLKRKHRTKLMRRWLMQLTQLNTTQKTFSKIIRLLTKSHNSPLPTALFMFHPHTWFLFLRLGAAKPWVAHTLLKKTSTIFRTPTNAPTLLPVSYHLYVSALAHLYEFFPFVLSAYYLRPQPKSYALNKPQHHKLPIPPPFLKFYDVPRRFEIDYTTLSIFILPAKTRQFFDWYGSLLYLNWNFIHSYNWAYHF